MKNYISYQVVNEDDFVIAQFLSYEDAVLAASSYHGLYASIQKVTISFQENIQSSLELVDTNFGQYEPVEYAPSQEEIDESNRQKELHYKVMTRLFGPDKKNWKSIYPKVDVSMPAFECSNNQLTSLTPSYDKAKAEILAEQQC